MLSRNCVTEISETTGKRDKKNSFKSLQIKREREDEVRKKEAGLTNTLGRSNNCTDEFLLANLTFFNFTLKVGDSL